MSIRALLLMAVLVPVLPLVLLLTSTLHYAAEADEAAAEAVSLVVARTTAHRVDLFLDQWTGVAARLAERAKSGLPGACAAVDGDFLLLHPQFDDLMIIDGHGRVTCSASGSSRNVADQPWFRAAILSAAPSYGEPVRSTSGQWISVLGRAVVDADGGVVGLVALPIRLDRLEGELQESMTSTPGHQATVVSPTGTVLARAPQHDRWVGTDARVTAIGARVLEVDEGTLTAVGLDGVERVYGFCRTRLAGWHVYSGSTRAALLAQTERRRAESGRVPAVGLAILLSVVLGLIVGRRISQSVTALAEVARRLTAGESARARVEGPREVADVAVALNAMLDARDVAAETAERHTLVLDSLHDAVIGWKFGPGLLPTIVSWNAAAERQYGYSAGQVLGRSPIELLSTSADGLDGLRAVSTTVSQFHSVHRRSDGTLLDVDGILFKAACGQRFVAVTRDVTAAMRAEREREELFAELKVLSRRLLDVQEAERRHLARELHDEVGQLLTGVKLALEMSQAQPLEPARATVADAVVALQQLIELVRELSLRLRPAMLDDLGLAPTLRWLVARHLRPADGPTVSLDVDEAGRFAPEIECAAYRIVQEALTNMSRHARARAVRVCVAKTGTTLALQVHDDGVGFDLGAVVNGAGLLGIKERARLLGGACHIRSAPGEGTSVEVQLPLVGGEPGAGESLTRLGP